MPMGVDTDKAGSETVKNCQFTKNPATLTSALYH
jgi:hypothetical protein